MNRLILAAVLLCPAAAAAAVLEPLDAAAGRDFLLAPASLGASVQAAGALARLPQKPQTAIQQVPVLRALGAGENFGSELGRVNLNAQLNRTLHLLRETRGAGAFDVGMAADAGANTRFLTFTNAAGTVLGRIGSLGDLRGGGVNLRIDAATVYNFRIQIGSIFNDPVRNSTLYVTPAQGTRGPSHEMTTGALLDAVRANSALIDVDGDEYEIFYGSDARPDGRGFTGARSLLITHEAGLSTQYWPLS